jgi:cystathionine gamma-synthase
MGASDVLLRVLVRPATTSSSRTTPTAARSGSSTRSSRRGASSTPSVDLADLDALRAALRPTTRVVWCETPTNPLLGIADIAAVADVTREAGARLVVDNTFASPYLQQPLASARTSSCTPRPSTSAVTRTSSAARSSPATTSSPSS